MRLFAPSITRSLPISAGRLRTHPRAGSPLRPAARPITTSLSRNSGVSTPPTPSPSKPELPLGTPSPTEAPPAPLAAVPAPRLFDLTNRTIIVAGAARGLGLTVARAFLEAGAHVQALDLLPKPDEPAWSQTQKVAVDRGVTLTYGTLDVTDQLQVHDVFEKCFDAAPTNAPVRGLFVSAGIQLMIDAIDYPADKFRKLIDVNLTGTFLCAQAFAREWTSRNPNTTEAVEKAEHSVSTGNTASIVMTASMSGSVANRGINAAPYNASKAGVVQLGRNLAMEWGERGIRVNTLSPGYIRTALTAKLLQDRPDFNELWLGGSLLGRLSTPDEFRGPAIFMLSDASSFMTGADLIVDGGHTAT